MTEQSPWGQPPQQSPYGQPPGAPYSAGPPPPPGGGYPAPGYGGPQGPQGPKKSRTGLVVGAVVAVVVVIGLVIGGIVLATGGDDSETAGDDASESASESPTDEATEGSSEEPTEDTSEEPTEEPTDDGGGQTSDGTSMFGDGYSYDLPGKGWQDSTEEARAAGAGTAIDTMSILGASITVAQSNILVEAGPSGGEDVEALQAVWERNISGTDGAVPESIDGRDIDGEQSVGLRIERVNNSNQDITQLAYLVVHDDLQYSIALSFPRGDSVSEEDFTRALDSWTWD